MGRLKRINETARTHDAATAAGGACRPDVDTCGFATKRLTRHAAKFILLVGGPLCRKLVAAGHAFFAR